MPNPPATFEIRSVGWVRSPRDEIRYDHWGGLVSEIEIDGDLFAEDSLLGIEGFSHLEVVFLFDRISAAEIVTGALHPRGRVDLPRQGIFATRAIHRTNRIAVSRCELLARDGLRLRVSGLDAIDATPVIDIKPYIAEFAPRGETRQPAWLSELLAQYHSPG